jgi:hypothetical protein
MATIKIARVRMSAEILQRILRGDWSNVCHWTTAPDDLEVLGVEQPSHAVGQWFYAIVQSKTFAAIPEGAEIPEIEPFTYSSEGARP